MSVRISEYLTKRALNDCNSDENRYRHLMSLNHFEFNTSRFSGFRGGLKKNGVKSVVKNLVAAAFIGFRKLLPYTSIELIFNGAVASKVPTPQKILHRFAP